MSKTMSFKIDVDTHDGMKNGVPVLLDIFDKFQVQATFFLSFGPDNAGKAIYQIFRQHGFLKKMLRTNAPGLYGLRTILSGTLLPARPIAVAFPQLVKRIHDAGHEVGVHAWDHRYWQDHLHHLSEQQVAAQFAKSLAAFAEILGQKATAVAAPGWQITKNSLMVQDRLGLIYASDLRDGTPCFPQMEGYTATTLQIPTTTRCLEELIATDLRQEEAWAAALLSDLGQEQHPVFPLHAEVEGGIFQKFFVKLLPKLLERHSHPITLQQYAQTLLNQKDRLEVREARMRPMPGRGGCIGSCCDG